MATAGTQSGLAADKAQLLDAWLGRLGELLGQVDAWAKESDWSTRRIEKRLEDSRVGPYKAPALVLQKDTVRALLEPVARSAPGAEGVVEFYLMPAYDDVASLYYYDGGWQLHYTFPAHDAAGTAQEATARPLSKDALGVVLAEMMKNAS
ncbi:MAG: hypothetical protein JO339_38755 [Alphaproteobacteria bacterium]|nr:hypothetical protein [Alphaproteobacteria bacterium]